MKAYVWHYRYWWHQAHPLTRDCDISVTRRQIQIGTKGTRLISSQQLPFIITWNDPLNNRIRGLNTSCPQENKEKNLKPPISNIQFIILIVIAVHTLECVYEDSKRSPGLEASAVGEGCWDDSSNWWWMEKYMSGKTQPSYAWAL